MKSKLKAGVLCATALALTAVVGQGTAQANPVGVTYQVTVKSSFGTTFTDCFTFTKSGKLTVGGYGVLAFAFQNLGTNKKRYQSVSPLLTGEGAGYTIQFNGYALGNDSSGYMLANGSNEFGDSFAVSGPPSSSCAAAPKTSGSPYRAPQN